MILRDYWARVEGRYYRTTAHFLFKRPIAINLKVPLVSFTFDDFPKSALRVGGAILEKYGIVGTYYASLGLMGKDSPTGEIFIEEDLRVLLEHGHELGCHTFGHCHSAKTSTRVFETSVIENQLALKRILPGVSFKSFSYPISPPRVGTKRRLAERFVCCRGGGQTFNARTADLNYLAAYFLEKSGGNVEAIKDLIRENQQQGGWLIFATHDVSETPTPFGCTPDFFERVVQSTVNSGAQILPVFEAGQLLGKLSPS